MWFKFPPGEDGISVERQSFSPEWTNKEGAKFFRAPAHFKDRLVRDGGCVALVITPEGAPEDLPDLPMMGQQVPVDDGATAEILSLKTQLSDEKSTSSALRAELSARMHELDTIKLEAHELRERMNELESNLEDKGMEVPAQVQGEEQEEQQSYTRRRR